MPVTTANDILETHSIEKVNVLSLDVEGNEVNVCRGLDWDKYQPDIVILEHTSPAGSIKDEITSFFQELGGYTLRHTTEPNFIFVRDEYWEMHVKAV